MPITKRKQSNIFPRSLKRSRQTSRFRKKSLITGQITKKINRIIKIHYINSELRYFNGVFLIISLPLFWRYEDKTSSFLYKYSQKAGFHQKYGVFSDQCLLYKIKHHLYALKVFVKLKFIKKIAFYYFDLKFKDKTLSFLYNTRYELYILKKDRFFIILSSKWNISSLSIREVK